MEYILIIIFTLPVDDYKGDTSLKITMGGMSNLAACKSAKKTWVDLSKLDAIKLEYKSSTCTRI